MNKLSKSNNLFGAIFIFFLMLGLYIKDEMIHIAMLEMSSGDFGYSRYYIVGMMFVGMFYFITTQSNRTSYIKLPKEGRVFVCFILITYVLSILLSFHSGFNLLSDYVARLLPIIVLFIAYSLFQKAENFEKVFFFAYIYAIYLGFMYVTYSSKRIAIINIEDTVNSSVYSILYLLPILLCTKFKMLKTIAITIIGVLVVLSAKRGGFVAFILGLIVYILVGMICAKKLKFKHVVLVSVLLIGVVIGLKFLVDSEAVFLFSRMDGIDDYGYGDRGDLYPKVFRMIINSDIAGMIFGHGYDAVLKDLAMGYSAHNDFLEIWYDYGLIGLVSYLIVWYYAIKVGLKMIKNKSTYASPYFLTLSILFVNSMVSHIVFFNQYLMMFAFSMGSIWSLYHREQIIA